LMYKWIIGSYYWSKKVVVTNKRIIISFQWFGYESFVNGMSCYYNKKDYIKYKRSMAINYLIINHEVGKGRILGDYIKFAIGKFLPMNIKIYTNENRKIEGIIKKSKS